MEEWVLELTDWSAVSLGPFSGDSLRMLDLFVVNIVCILLNKEEKEYSPDPRHLRHSGFVSSHFMCRCLHVKHPVLVFGIFARLRRKGSGCLLSMLTETFGWKGFLR